MEYPVKKKRKNLRRRRRKNESPDISPPPLQEEEPLVDMDTLFFGDTPFTGEGDRRTAPLEE